MAIIIILIAHSRTTVVRRSRPTHTELQLGIKMILSSHQKRRGKETRRGETRHWERESARSLVPVCHPSLGMEWNERWADWLRARFVSISFLNLVCDRQRERESESVRVLSCASSANRIAVSAALRWHSIKFVIVIYAIHAHIQTCTDTCVYTLRSPLIRSPQAHTHMHCGAPCVS